MNDQHLADDLCRFYDENSPTPIVPTRRTDADLGRRLLFAAHMAQGDPRLPRTLRAHQLVWAIPQTLGEIWVSAVETEQP